MHQKTTTKNNLPEVLLQRQHVLGGIPPVQPYATEIKLTVLVILLQSIPGMILLSS